MKLAFISVFSGFILGFFLNIVLPLFLSLVLFFTLFCYSFFFQKKFLPFLIYLVSGFLLNVFSFFHYKLPPVISGRAYLLYKNYSYSIYKLNYEGRRIYFLTKNKNDYHQKHISLSGKASFNKGIYFYFEPSIKIRPVKFNFFSFVLKKSFYLEEKYRSFYLKIITGERIKANQELELKLHSLGLDHLKAISGLHIGILYLFLRFMRFPDILSAFLVGFYIYLIGFKISALRAYLIGGFYLYSFQKKKPYFRYHYLFLSALIMLILFPYRFYSWGSFLSFYATFLIVFYLKHKKEIFPFYFPNVLALSTYLFWNLMPFTVYLTGTIYFSQIFANLIFIPLFSLLYPFSVFCLILPPLFFILNWFFTIFDKLLDWSYFLTYLNILVPDYLVKFFYLLGLLKATLLLGRIDDKEI